MSQALAQLSDIERLREIKLTRAEQGVDAARQAMLEAQQGLEAGLLAVQTLQEAYRREATRLVSRIGPAFDGLGLQRQAGALAQAGSEVRVQQDKLAALRQQLNTSEQALEQARNHCQQVRAQLTAIQWQKKDIRAQLKKDQQRRAEAASEELFVQALGRRS
ncbi:MAG: hypothetical protein CME36_11690 [unclassified Hahellaceae]|nr:hypothetical protein [Hahellaceae bacterium]|tara:strand:- start:19162 stop:19647 length:486 start_codon:yes stop_codon:yes gene_type:complete